MGGEQDGAAGRLVDAARLHADEAVFQKIETANAVLAAIFVEGSEQRGRGHGLAIDRDSVAALKADADHFGRIGRVFRIDRALMNKFGRFNARVFEGFAFGAGVQKVGIDGEGCFAALVGCDGNAMLFSKIE